MSHHGWIPVIDQASITPAGLKSPFGRLFPASDNIYNSHAISLLSGALGPMQTTGASTAGSKPGNPTGFTFLGQFIDHDMTEFRVLDSKFGIILQNPTIDQRQLVLEDRRIKGEFPTTTNGRSGKLDLDSVYGLLGVTQLDLFDEEGMFRLRSNIDIIRNENVPDGRLIADFRNDENKIIVQLHILFERLHNKIHQNKPGTTREKGPGGIRFNETKAQVQRIYRNIIVNDYLPRIVRTEQLEDVANALKEGKTFYQKMTQRNRNALKKLGIPEDEIKNSIAVPVEFSHAAFRLGHSQLLPAYKLNNNPGVPLFELGTGKPDLRGKSRIEDALIIDWSHFFKINNTVQPGMGLGIDGELAESIFRLPAPAIDSPPVSLAERNIRRGVDFGLPSGQEVASYLTETYGYIKMTTVDELFPSGTSNKPYAEILKMEPHLAYKTPLWYYILKEAEQFKDNAQLGPVGGYIVAETLLGSLAETDGVGIDLLRAQIATLEDPNSVPYTPPADIDNIKTMGQMIAYINS